MSPSLTCRREAKSVWERKQASFCTASSWALSNQLSVVIPWVLMGLRGGRGGRSHGLETPMSTSSTLKPMFAFCIWFVFGICERNGADGGLAGVPFGDLSRLVANSSKSSHSPALSDREWFGLVFELLSGVSGMMAGRDLCLDILLGLSRFIMDILFCAPLRSGLHPTG